VGYERPRRARASGAHREPRPDEKGKKKRQEPKKTLTLGEPYGARTPPAGGSRSDRAGGSRSDRAEPGIVGRERYLALPCGDTAVGGVVPGGGGQLPGAPASPAAAA